MTTGPPSTEGFIEVGATRLHYLESGSGPPIVLLHAGIADSRMWEPQVETFRSSARVIRYDLRGFGLTEVASGRFAHRDDVAALMRALDVERAVLIGVSFGGYVALDVALAYPDMVEALVLSAPAVSGWEPQSEELTRFFAEETQLLDQEKLDAAAALNVDVWVVGAGRTADDVDPGLRQLVQTMQRDAFAVEVPAGAEAVPLLPPAFERLEEIAAPTLVIVGEADVPEFVALSTVVADRIPGARRVVIPDTAHLPSLERPEAFNDAVQEFVGGLK